MIQVLIVDDSAVSRALLSGILQSEPDISVIGTASDGSEAVSLARLLKPDIITMDIHMPGIDGFEATRQIMEQSPVPIIIVSGVDNLSEIAASFRVMEAGALAVIPKPPSPDNPSFQAACQEIRTAVRTYVEVKVVRRTRTRPVPEKPQVKKPPVSHAPVSLVVIGASTGGPPAVQSLLSRLTKPFPVPIMLVQHMSPGFIGGFAEWLSDSTGFPVRVAEPNEQMQPGFLYVAPDGVHTGVSSDLRVLLSHDPPEHSLRPSVSFLFRSVAENVGSSAVGVLLTGMGTDGSFELLMMHEKGSVTIIQDRESSIVYGMPGEALRIGAASYILPPEEIATELENLTAGGGYEKNKGHILV
jgi:two-component system chemotaxis response regulator CheB